MVGDIQGCARTFDALLERIAFDAERDELWLVGDLVNRGPDNVHVLRRARALSATVVLGNHDLHLLARVEGLRPRARLDTLDDVLAAPDGEELVSWLAARPFLVRRNDVVMVHAAIDPRWTWREASSRADQARELLASRRREVITQLAHRRPPPADPEVISVAADIAVFTRMRMVDSAGKAEPRYAGPPEDAPPGLRPWYADHALEPDLRVYFGHWAALDVRRLGRFTSLDSGCVWGRRLTALRLEDGEVVSVDTLDRIGSNGGGTRP